jgi:peptidoglycan/LPS O-acetylase OafA/YrhL
MINNIQGRRYDIDLLRALAVMAVMLFHFDVPGFSGGFLGVDVFFVISGYLITKHLQEQIQTGSFTFVYFYARRIRRLMPALFVTLLFTSIIALAVFPKQMLSDFSESMFASSIYLSNVYFWSQTGYFDTASHLKPLLHTWSLSVEEQFYLFWPLFILLIVSLGKSRLIIAVVGLLSLIAAELLYDKGTSLTFFMFPFRIFEFAIGAFIYKSQLNQSKTSHAFLLALLGWVLIVGSLFLLDDTIKMPGLLSLPICLGTALVIYSHYRFNENNLLVKLGVRIGLISYSAYLIHWPLVVFYKYSFSETLQAVDILVLVTLTLILAEIMYRYVEQLTIRLPINKPVFNYAWVLGIIIFSTAYLNLSPQLYPLVQFDRGNVRQLIDNTPTSKDTRKSFSSQIKEFGTRENVETIVVIGDSHSASLLMALGPYIAQRVITKGNICDPITSESLKGVNLSKHYLHHTNKDIIFSNCKEYHEKFIEELTALNPDMVIFSERWQVAALPYLSKTIREIRNKVTKKIMLMGPNLEFVQHPINNFSDITSIKELNRIAKSRLLDLTFIERSIIEIARQEGVYFLSKAELVCPRGNCTFHNQIMFNYSDTNHWSKAGLSLYGRRMSKSKVFQDFTSENNRPKNISNSWNVNIMEINYKQKATPKKNVNELYAYTQSVNRFNTVDRPILVVGDYQVRELVSALFLSENYKNKYIVGELGPKKSRCAPIAKLSGEFLLEKIYAGRGDVNLQCSESHDDFINRISMLNPSQIFISYNWTNPQLSSLSETIEAIKKKITSDIYLLTIKPRVFNNPAPKVRVPIKVNENLKVIAKNKEVHLIDMVDIFCKGNKIEQCYDRIKHLYESPRTLNLKGVDKLASYFSH